MTDFLSFCPINLGRWGSTQVRVHLLFVVFVPLTLLSAAAKGFSVAQTAGWLALLIVAVALHELGHAVVAGWIGADPEEVRLWPLGNLGNASPPPAYRASETRWVAAGGLAMSLALTLLCAIALSVLGAKMAWNPLGSRASGAPTLATGAGAVAFSLVWWIGWFGFLNWVLFLANLLPALPMDQGRIVRSFLVSHSIGQPRDSMVAPYLAWAVAAVLFLGGLVRLVAGHPESGSALLCLAILIFLMARAEVRMFEEGAFFEEGLFGYDFSEGYTSLESSTQTVRPHRESALRRWRRRRSELRRQRRLAKEAAEEQRMDEILAKLHSQGRSALTDEEQRFLVRVSAKYRTRPRAHD